MTLCHSHIHNWMARLHIKYLQILQTGAYEVSDTFFSRIKNAYNSSPCGGEEKAILSLSGILMPFPNSATGSYTSASDPSCWPAALSPHLH